MSCSTWRFAGSCSDAKTLDAQVRRMLADPRARTALVQNFFSQWLQVRNVWLLTPDANRQYPWFDDNLRTAFVKETELFLESQLRDDRSIVELLTANYTYPQRTAGAPLWNPRRLRKPFPPRDADGPEPLGSARQGEHPVGDVLPAPHLADDSRQVAAREYSGGSRAAATAEREHHPRRREDGEDHRLCARCSSITARIPRARAAMRNMDPLGFSLENFDAIGQWRTTGWGRRRSMRPACCWTAPASMGRRRFADRAAAAEGAVRQGGHGKAADVRAGPRDRLPRRPGDSRDRCAPPRPTTTAGRRRFWRS